MLKIQARCNQVKLTWSIQVTRRRRLQSQRNLKNRLLLVDRLGSIISSHILHRVPCASSPKLSNFLTQPRFSPNNLFFQGQKGSLHFSAEKGKHHSIQFACFKVTKSTSRNREYSSYEYGEEHFSRM